MNADDNEIFDLTGCLSKCDKYMYSAWPLNDLQNLLAEEVAKDYSVTINTTTLWLNFIVQSAEYELREQVLCPQVLKLNKNKDEFISVHGL